MSKYITTYLNHHKPNLAHAHKTPKSIDLFHPHFISGLGRIRWICYVQLICITQPGSSKQETTSCCLTMGHCPGRDLALTLDSRRNPMGPWVTKRSRCVKHNRVLISYKDLHVAVDASNSLHRHYPWPEAHHPFQKYTNIKKHKNHQTISNNIKHIIKY